MFCCGLQTNQHNSQVSGKCDVFVLSEWFIYSNIFVLTSQGINFPPATYVIIPYEHTNLKLFVCFEVYVLQVHYGPVLIYA